MEVCIGYIRKKAVMLSLKNGITYIDNEAQPIKGLTEHELATFSQAIAEIPYSLDPSYQALLNARRAAFIASILGRAVGDECVSRLTHILDSVHVDVLAYLEDTDT